MRLTLSSPLRLWRAALVLVLIACATPGSARAECGDYVTVLNAPSGQASHATVPPPAPLTPCHGPNCSRPPDGPAAPATPVLTLTTAKDAAQTAQASLPPAEQAAGFPRDNTSARPAHRPKPVFHPPRV